MVRALLEALGADRKKRLSQDFEIEAETPDLAVSKPSWLGSGGFLTGRKREGLRQE